MIANPIRAWRFAHPDFSSEPSPGLGNSATGGVAMIDNDDALRQGLLLLVSTTPGERVMRPDYGCSLNRLVFAPNDDSSAGLAIHYLRQAVERWEPRVTIKHIDATRDAGNPGLLVMELRYAINSSQREDQITFSFDLTGGVS